MSTDYSKLTVKDLQDLLKERSLPTAGKKAELIERLKEADKKSAPGEDEINWEEDAATTAGSAAIAAGGQGQVMNPTTVPNQTPAIDPAATDDLTAKKTVQVEVTGKDATASATDAEAATEKTAAAEETKPAADFTSGLAATSVDEEIAKRKRRAEKFGLNLDESEALKNLERQKRFGGEGGEGGVSATAQADGSSAAAIRRLDEALPERRKRGRGEGENAGSSFDDDGLKRRRGGFRGRGRFRGGGGGDRERVRDGKPNWMNDTDRQKAEARRSKFG